MNISKYISFQISDKLKNSNCMKKDIFMHFRMEEGLILYAKVGILRAAHFTLILFSILCFYIIKEKQILENWSA